MLIKTIQLGANQANCYIVMDEKSGSAAVIDPGGYESQLTTALNELAIKKLEFILLTHGHYDHIMGAFNLKQKFPDAKLAVHENDALCLEDDKKSLAIHIGDNTQSYIKADVGFEDGACFTVGETLLTVLHTPGHTRGSVCFICEEQKALFSGDTVFQYNVGRTDLPGGSLSELMASINKISSLKGDYDIYPGAWSGDDLRQRTKEQSIYEGKRMILRVLGHKFHYEMENLCRVFFPQEKIKVVRLEVPEADEKIVTTILERKDDSVTVSVKVDIGSESTSCERIIDPENSEDLPECERHMALALYAALTKITGYIPGWGILTGVRPTKIMRTLIEQYGEPGAIDYFKEKLLVSDEKTEIAFLVTKNEEKIIKKAKESCFSLYIAIPFCPSRCSYCSFVSQSIAGPKAREIVSEYVVNLCSEIESVGEIAARLGLKPQTVYFGGGTPTTLEETDLEALLETVSNNFDLSQVDEYTVEAGRPDTVSAQKLHLIKKYGVSRISINPQTFNDKVLETVQRKHTSKCTMDAFKLARSVNFNSMNMDLIAGLPEEAYDSFLNSLDITVGLGPENITVHTLALKRSSSLYSEGKMSFNGETVSEMIRAAKTKLEKSNYIPYYMYRQSLSPGNNENVGWCKEGYESLYNVFMMEECQTVLAAGAGAVTKLKQSAGKHIERIFNFKYPFEYNNRFEEIIARKSRIEQFYNKFG